MCLTQQQSRIEWDEGQMRKAPDIHYDKPIFPGDGIIYVILIRTSSSPDIC